MSTSLKEQLLRHAVPQSSAVVRTKKRASFLFNPKEAAEITRDTFYQIGRDGFDELKKKNPLFAQFENNLFNKSSIRFERSVQDAAANKKLDKVIRKFFIVLSPYFMLSCSHKALEWLINRYNVHEYNRNDLLMLVLPYHETNLFVRAVQVMIIKDNDNFTWLKSLQKKGVHLQKATLYNHAASNTGFMKDISDFVLAATKVHETPHVLSTLFNFYCMTFTGALEYAEKVDDRHVTHMLGALINGLKSPVVNFCAGSYIIAAKLLSKTTLSEKLLIKFVENITQVHAKVLYSDALLLLVVLYQTQTHFTEISEVAMSNIAQLTWIPKMLQQLIEGGNLITSFLSPLFQAAIKYAIVEEDGVVKKFVHELLNVVTLSDDFVAVLINTILNVYKPNNKKTPAASHAWMKEIITSIEKKYPNIFDQEINRILKVVPGEPMTKHQKRFQKLISNSASLQNSAEMLQQLYHPVPSIRKQSIKILMKNYNGMKEREQVFLKDALLDRLNDDNPDVVNEALKCTRKFIVNLIDDDTLRGILIKLLRKCQSDKENWWVISRSVLAILCDIGGDTLVFLSILPFLIPSDAGELKVSKSIVETRFFKNCNVFTGLEGSLSSIEDPESFASVILGGLSKNRMEIISLIESLKTVEVEDRDTLHMYLAGLLLCSSLPENCPANISVLVLDILISYVDTSKLVALKKFKSVSNCVVMVRQNKFPLQGFLQLLEILIAKSEKPNLSAFDYCGDSTDSTKFYVTVLKILLTGCNFNKDKVSHLYTGALKKFLDHFDLNFQSKINMFLNVAIANSRYIDPMLQFRCLKIVLALVERNPEDYSKFFEMENTFIPYVLVCLENESKEIRKCAFAIIETLIKNVKTNGNQYVFVLKKLAQFKDELLLDKNQISVVMNNIIETHDASVTTVVDSLVRLLSENDQPMYAKIGIGYLVLHNSNNNEILDKLAEICFKILERNEELNSLESGFISSTIDKITSDLTLESKLTKFISSAIRNDVCIVNSSTVLSAVVLAKIDKDNFETFNNDLKQLFLGDIIQIATSSQNSEVLTATNKIFKHIDLDSKLIIDYLLKMRDVKSPKITETKRKRRVSVIPTVDILDTNEWKAGITVLECIQDKKKIRNAVILLPVLFEILNKCLDFDEQGNVEYPKQLVLSSILNSCHRLDGTETLPKNTFNVQLIVKCIRASQNPQTHHDALLLLAHTAHLIPNQVLHHIMTIFTFMGSAVLRHDDAYSFQIINKIVDTIIPIFVANDTNENIGSILRVFVDSILDVPEHRRMALYKNLLDKTGVDNNLHIFLLLMFESHVTHSSVEKHAKESSARNIATPKRLDIAADVARLFTPSTVIANCTKLIKYLQTLPEDKDDLSNSTKLLVDIKHQTQKQYRHYKYIILTFTSNLLSSKEFVSKIAALPDDILIELEPLHKDMIINSLTYISTVSKTSDRNHNSTLAQYWKVMLHHSYDVLDSVNALLTPQMFLLVIRGLSTHNILTIRRRALELLNSKLQHDTGFFQHCTEAELHAMLPCLINIIKRIEDTNSINSDEELIIQTALLSLKLFVKLLIVDNQEKFVSILDFITNIIVSGKAVDNILASTILCLAELCSQLRAHAISNLGKYMPALLKLLKVHKHKELPDLLLLSTITAIQKIIESLPLFLSPYLQKLLFELSRITSRWGGNQSNPKLQPFLTKLNNIKIKIGTTVPARVLIPAIEESYKKLISTNSYSSIGALMDILTEKFKNIKNADIQSNLSELTSFFINALQFRADNLTSLSETNAAEKHIVNALVTLILKLSESSFRPLYYRIYDWAVRSDLKNERVITFYALSSNVANSLKGLFVLFAGHFVNNAATILDSCNIVKQKEIYFDDEDKTVLLLDYVLETLHNVFLYDNQRFINKERFDVLMQPIIDQLENTLGGNDVFLKRANDLLIPAIVQFAVATGDDSLWKQLNYQILLKMRHTAVNIRLTALKCVLEFSRKLGEDFLPLLPETIPFLAELLEDEDEEVEKTCKRTVQEMEKVLGEPLQKYF